MGFSAKGKGVKSTVKNDVKKIVKKSVKKGVGRRVKGTKRRFYALPRLSSRRSSRGSHALIGSALLLDIRQEHGNLPVERHGEHMHPAADVLQGTLDLLI